MNGIEKITSRIITEAQQEAAAVTAEAAKNAADISGKYEVKAQLEYDTRLNNGIVELKQHAQRLDRAARLEAKKNILAEKQALINAAYDKAKEMIVKLPEDRYVAFIARQAAEAAVTGKEKLILNEADRQRLGARAVAAANELVRQRGVSPELSLSEETREISGGLILKNGNIETNCSVDSLLELCHNSMDTELVGVLFN